VENIEMDLDGMDWTGLTQKRDTLKALVNVVMNIQVP
jgi:hypothetical protein